METSPGPSHVQDYLRPVEERNYNRQRGSTNSIFGTESSFLDEPPTPAGFTDGRTTNRSLSHDDRAIAGGGRVAGVSPERPRGGL